MGFGWLFRKKQQPKFIRVACVTYAAGAAGGSWRRGYITGTAGSGGFPVKPKPKSNVIQFRKRQEKNGSQR